MKMIWHAAITNNIHPNVRGGALHIAYHSFYIASWLSGYIKFIETMNKSGIICTIKENIALDHTPAINMIETIIGKY